VGGVNKIGVSVSCFVGFSIVCYTIAHPWDRGMVDNLSCTINNLAKNELDEKERSSVQRKKRKDGLHAG